MTAPVLWVTTLASGLAVAADAPLASAKDNPAAPNTGTALLRRPRFGHCFTNIRIFERHESLRPALPPGKCQKVRDYTMCLSTMRSMCRLSCEAQSAISARCNVVG